MKEIYKDETFLARWIANELSPKELEEFQNSEAYHQFKAIDDASQLLKAPDYNQKEAFSKLQNKIQTKKKVVKLIPTWVYGAAAAIALLISVLYVNNNTVNFSSSYGEQFAISLPDNSKVHLSPNTSISYKKSNWKDEKDLFLEGEAFFEVVKGKTFTVNTNEGSVTVLGTKFTVNAAEDFLEVQCYEGKVKVITENKDEVILTLGKAFRSYKDLGENWDLKNASPTWLAGESSFVNTPLNQVIKALENQFNLTFDASKIDTNKRFTGTFTHKNVNIALETVFAPMKISYKLAKNSSVILTYN